ncbi:MAG: glycoside hydrolase family 97 protein [Candidatus Heimdallarchaeota archaeon]|nr:glycoside hydrolase family 97 protein [Candidatus Heimdallarchaeota archaeon]
MRLFPLVALIIIFSLSTDYQAEISLQINDTYISSPEENITLDFNLNQGVPQYSVEFKGETIIELSSLGFELENQTDMKTGFTLQRTETVQVDDTWYPVWGQHDTIRNGYTELKIELIDDLNRLLNIYFRTYDDGIAFRYEFPKQENLHQFNITNEVTEFVVNEDPTCWWIPDDFDSYEHLYTESSLSKALSEGVNTPFTCRRDDNIHFSIHEAALTNYSGMTLKGEGTTAISSLVPYYGSNIKVIASTPFVTPWRTIQLGDDPSDLLESNLILNLNEPNTIKDTSWITPSTYMGVWWSMHLKLETWEEGFRHGATTANVKTYVDTCVRLSCGAVLVEGWNTGWDNWAQQNLTEPTSDYDIDAVVQYAHERDIEIIGHLETGGNLTNYLKQGIREVFEYFKSKGIHMVKTGYAGVQPTNRILTPDMGIQHHHGQYMVNHYREVVQQAAELGIMINVHEPIKPTGIERTYPNMMTREGVRGMEYNAWGNPGNNPTHTTLLPFTRLLAGSADYTPGIFNFDFVTRNRHSTLAHQLALYVTLHSPWQMMADLAQSYYVDRSIDNALREETRFLKQIPTSWDNTIGLDSIVGEYVSIARNKGTQWYVGATSNEESRMIQIELDFLGDQEYYAIIYQDASNADYQTNPDAVDMYATKVSKGDVLDITMQRGGGVALHILPASEVDMEYILGILRPSSSEIADTPFVLSLHLLLMGMLGKRKNIVKFQT